MMDQFLSSREYKYTVNGVNYREGLQAFVDKREPKWVDSKL